MYVSVTKGESDFPCDGEIEVIAEDFNVVKVSGKLC